MNWFVSFLPAKVHPLKKSAIRKTEGSPLDPSAKSTRAFSVCVTWPSDSHSASKVNFGTDSG